MRGEFERVAQLLLDVTPALLVAAGHSLGWIKPIMAAVRRRRLRAANHFSVEESLLEAWASRKSLRPRDERRPRGGGRIRAANFRGQWRRELAGVAVRFGSVWGP